MSTHNQNPIDIRVVVERSGVPVSTLHLWERKGLISPVSRSGGRRQYDEEVLRQIAVIVLAQRSGFTLAEIGEMLEPGAFADGKRLIEVKLAELRMRYAETALAISSLEHALDCDEPSPLDCADFNSLLSQVLPRP